MGQKFLRILILKLTMMIKLLLQEKQEVENQLLSI